jgi:cell division protein FtsL
VNRRPSPVVHPSKLPAALLAIAIVAAGFAILMVRLEAIQEGYRLSALQLEVNQLERQNQRLKLEAAQLGSHQRLRALAGKYGLGPPARGQVVMIP